MPCDFCSELWAQIRNREDELTKLARHKGIYSNAIQQVQQEINWRMRKARQCREANHPEEQY